MRLFVAFELPERSRTEIRQALAAVREGLPAARWVPRERWHLTLRFLGETEPAARPALDRALGEAFAAAAPLAVRPRGAGWFPATGRAARVLWVGMEPGDGLAGVQRRAAEAAERELRLEREHRPYRAHLTVARLRSPWPAESLETWRAAMAGFVGSSFRIGEGVLVQSLLDPSGVRYRRLAAYPMGPS